MILTEEFLLEYGCRLTDKGVTDSAVAYIKEAKYPLNTTEDYDKFMDVVNQYESDADLMQEILASFAEKAEVMNGTMNNMNNGVQGITASVDESAKAVSSVAEDTSSLVSALTNIKDMSDDNMSVAQQMETEVGVFKVI